MNVFGKNEFKCIKISEVKMVEVEFGVEIF